MNAPLSSHLVVDRLLMDVARRIQLPPSDYRLAVSHYRVINEFLERENSPLHGLITRLYPQGSMQIGATIASRLRNDDVDVDIVIELAIPAGLPPAVVLDTLFRALNGELGSRYHGKVRRNTRCVTVDYDRMHLDLTPAVLMPEREERTSTIFHAHERRPFSEHRHIIANPWGFADWFEAMTPASGVFADAVLRKAAEPVPDQEELNEKSLPLVALQLIKRWRNKCYDTRKGRCPPSVVLAYFVATLHGRRTSLVAELVALARGLLAVFDDHDRRRALIRVVNPRCSDDVLSDRWPGTLDAQALFTHDLRDLVAQLDVLQQNPSVLDCERVLVGLFGEYPTRIVLEEFKKSYTAQAYNGALFHHRGAGGLAMAASGLSRTDTAAPAYATPRHTNYGQEIGR
jgi:hypothetical protein